MASSLQPGEQCDGSDLGAQDCHGLGHAGGTLSCDSACYFDTRHCDSCVRDHLDACISGLFDANASGTDRPFVVDAADGRIGIAWSAPLGNAHFGVLDQALHATGQPRCLGGAPAEPLALAAVPSGWLLALQVFPGIDLYWLDPSGAPCGQPRHFDGTHAYLGSRSVGGHSVGGPLFVWADDGPGPFHMALLDAAGDFETSPVAIDVAIIGAVFLGDAFLFTGWSAPPSPVVTGRIGLDGTLKQMQPIDGTVALRAQSLAKQGSDVYLFFGTGAVGAWVRLDVNGVPLGMPTPLSWAGDWTGPLVAFDSWVGVVDNPPGVDSEPSDVMIAPIAGGTAAPFKIGAMARWAQVVNDGTSPLVAWSGDVAQITVARVRP
jgi:hypothetical protein